MQAACMVMEAFEGYKEKFKVLIYYSYSVGLIWYLPISAVRAGINFIQGQQVGSYPQILPQTLKIEKHSS